MGTRCASATRWCCSGRRAEAGGTETVPATDRPDVSRVTEAQRRVLIALCRPFREGGEFADPATNKQVADEVFLSVDAVEANLRALFETFEVGDLPQNQSAYASRSSLCAAA